MLKLIAEKYKCLSWDRTIFLLQNLSTWIDLEKVGSILKSYRGI